jgi:thioredoxin-like negative regulator of GroEL
MQDWTPQDLQNHIQNGDKLFLKIWKKGCGACKLSIPAIERIEAANEFGLIFGQVNSDDFPEILEIAEAEVLPMFFVFAESEQKGRLEGFKGIEKLKAMIEDAMSTQTKQ